jgi:hypothetical protein
MSTTMLYRFYDGDGVLLYVGITSRHMRRWCEHAASKAWWPHVATTRVEHYPSRVDAEGAEREAIRAERPLHNVVHSVLGKSPLPPTIRAVAGRTKKQIVWACDVCDIDIRNFKGWLTVDDKRRPAWGIYHAECDPHPEGGYWIGVERVRTLGHLTEWDRHLRGKRWIADTDWHAIYDMAYEQVGT